MFGRFLFLLLITVFNIDSNAQINWPTITQSAKPWARWWWEGSAVNKKDLTWNLEQYKNAGLGGLELTPIYGVHGFEKEFINFLSPQWMEMFDFTLAESKRLGIGIDLANGTGWPFGGPWVKDEDASKTVYYKTYSLNAGEQLKENIFTNNRHWFVQQITNLSALIPWFSQFLQTRTSNRSPWIRLFFREGFRAITHGLFKQWRCN
jgi:hypothetical protein